MYLGGEFGSHPEDVNPYAASAFYAVDRYASLKKSVGNFTSPAGWSSPTATPHPNAVHQAVGRRSGGAGRFLRWLDDFEHNKLGLPAPIWSYTWICPPTAPSPLLRQRESDTPHPGRHP